MRTLKDLSAELAAHSTLATLAAALERTSTPLRIAPAPIAARAPLLAALAHHRRTPLLFVLSGADAALRIADDLRQWLGAATVLLYPAGDALPYEHMPPTRQVIGQRLRVLQTLATPGDPPVIVASVKALMQPTLTRTELSQATIRLALGETHRPEDLTRRLLDLGYRMASMVEEPGELNRRGDLLDVWPPAEEGPLRLGFFGDELESIRRFDPATQRSEARLEAALIGPPHEIPLWNRADAVTRMAALETDGLRKEARLEWEAALERLAQGENPQGCAFYAPFFRSGRGASLLDHLPPDTVVFLSEAQFLAQHAVALHEQAEDRRARLVAGGELPPDFPRPYLLWEELFPTASTTDGPRLVDLSGAETPPGANSPFTTITLDDLRFEAATPFSGQFRRLVADIVERLRRGERVLAVTTQAARLQDLVDEALQESSDAAARSRFYAIHSTLEGGWRLPALRLTIYTDSEIFGIRPRRPPTERRQRSADDRAAFMRGLKPGDYVVHIEHGIAQYEGLIRRVVGAIEREYLVLRYAGDDKIYVPVDQVDRVTRYIGAGDAAPTLTRLGTQEWERAKRKVRAAVQDLAEELLTLYARRQMKQGYAYSPDNEWQRELEAAFPYLETPDQLRAIADVKRDMERPVPMDRLVCGDVGFGKTEVALRAAFKAAQDGKQVAVLVPTTVLAQQHFDTFRKRMAPFPVRVEMLSRFRTSGEQQAILDDLARGRIEIVIGTHRLLSNDVRFKDLGLVIVDEEQRFGVRHKERLKQLRAEVDVLTLTATPIPRTLHMALAGIRDLSVIDTPPENRLPIKTYVMPYNETLVREAINRELERDGQVYFVHNRVQSIYHVANRLRHLVPEARIGVGHGQLDERALERVMLDFFEGRYDVLVCTTIIESGLDVPNANTLIVDDATMYGLAQLYQLRGRVGRSAHRAYAYLLYRQDRPMTPEAQARLEAIQEATELGAGFRIAMRDLEIRGAGNLLGAEQSGHIAAVGFDLYTRLLEQAVRQLKAGVDRAAQHSETGAAPSQPAVALSEAASKLTINEKVLVSPLVTLDLPLTAYLPEDYIPDPVVRVAMYQRMTEARTVEEVRALQQELYDRFGKPPEAALHLLTWLQIKALALRAGVSSVVAEENEFIIRLPILESDRREWLRRRFLRDRTVKIGPQFVRLDRRALADDWSEKLIGLLSALAA